MKVNSVVLFLPCLGTFCDCIPTLQVLVSAPDPPCTRKKKRKESAEEGLVQLTQNNLQSAEFQRVESDWLIGN